MGQLKRFFYNHDTASALRRSISKHDPEALLCHNLYPVGSPSAYDVANETGVPVIQYLHNYRPFSVGGAPLAGNRIRDEGLRQNWWPEVMSGAWQGSVIKSALFALMLRRLHQSGWLESVKCWVAISEFLHGKFLEAGLPPERVVTLKHAWRPKPEVPASPEGSHYLFLSRLVREKGVWTLLKAWELLEQEMGAGCPRLVIGGLGPEMPVVQSCAERSGHVDYVGFVQGEHKESLIRGSRALIAPSIWWEPSGLVTFEAYEFSKPILAGASGGLVENVIHGRTGLLHTPGDARALADSVIELEKMGGARRREMGQEGREWLSRMPIRKIGGQGLHGCLIRFAVPETAS